MRSPHVAVPRQQGRRIPCKTWRECIRKVWEVDPLKCPRCHVEMKIIRFIAKFQADVIRKILEDFGLCEKQIKPPPDFSFILKFHLDLDIDLTGYLI